MGKERSPARMAAVHRALHRWHFLAGILVAPFVIVLALTGAAYLFKPELDRWDESAFHAAPTAVTARPSAQRDAALARMPGARMVAFRLPQNEGDPAMVRLALPDGGAREVFVSGSGEVLGSIDPARRWSALIQRFHGQLMIGAPGGWLVELAASWAIFLIVSGIYLWWPRSRRAGGTVLPRFGQGAGLAWRDLHAVGGFWVAGSALILLVSGLPWTGLWGTAFSTARALAANAATAQDWTINGKAPAGEHEGHEAPAAGAMGTHHGKADLFDQIVARARSERLAFPAFVVPPRDPHGPWLARSEAQNRPLRVTVRYDLHTGQPLSRETFKDKPAVDRLVGYGVAWHEGQLAGWVNRAVGLATAALLIVLAVAGLVHWLRRRPRGGLGAPARVPAGSGRGALVLLVVAGLLLPMLGLSLVALLLIEATIRPGAGRQGLPAG